MLKTVNSLKETEDKAADAFRELLERIPNLQIEWWEQNARLGDLEADIVVDVLFDHKPRRLICEVKGNGQPRYADRALYQLHRLTNVHRDQAIPVFIAPFLSKDVRERCINENVAYVDFAGNARIAFDGVYIEREAADNPFREKREVRSLFKPKAAQILRVLLGDDALTNSGTARAWRVTELADAAKVSLGQVSNIRSALIERGFAEEQDDGLVLTAPEMLLDAWRESYPGPEGHRLTFYTPLHGRELATAFRGALHGGSDHNRPRAVLSSFSAADWLAPYGRTGMTSVYVDNLGRLMDDLQLTNVGKGENVVVTILKDEGPLLDAREVTDGIWCTSPIQTYLDLAQVGNRGREAAEHLKEKRLPWAKSSQTN